MLTIVSRFGTLSYRVMVTIHFMPRLGGGDDRSALWKRCTLADACRKLTPEQHRGYEVMCGFEKSIAMDIARHFDRTRDPMSPGAVQRIAKLLRN